MKPLYEIAGISRQALWKWALRRESRDRDAALVLTEVRRLRALHPRMGCRKLYSILRPGGMGRDGFFELLSEAGLLVARKRSARRTTWSVKAWQYPNLMEGLAVSQVDQVWVTDITYFFIGEDCYYIVLLMDLYSRCLLGYSVETHMRASSCLAALKMAIGFRGVRDYRDQLIHHSDRGAQYVSADYLKRLSDAGIRVSLCLKVYENTHIERLNRTIKEEYLGPKRPGNLRDLKAALRQTALLYNRTRPHESLGGLTPNEYETMMQDVPPEKRPIMRLYVDPNTSRRNQLRNQMTIFD